MFQVLVVEDNWHAKDFLLEMLGVSALVDVVKTVRGIEEARHALNAPTTINAAFVLATEKEGHALEAFDRGVFDYLVKPFRGGGPSYACAPIGWSAPRTSKGSNVTGRQSSSSAQGCRTWALESGFPSRTSGCPLSGRCF